MTTSRPVVLVELEAAVGGGHWVQAAVRLCQQAQTEKRPCGFVSAGVVDGSARAELERAGAILADMEDAPGVAIKVLRKVGNGLSRSGRWAATWGWHHRWPHQVAALGRCLTEAAAVRIATALFPAARPAVVILTANGVLHTLTARLSGARHVRVVHELPTREDRPLRMLSSLAGTAGSRVRVICPTDAVAAHMRVLFPRLGVAVQPFALADLETRLSDRERRTARAGRGAASGRVGICLVGGWWPHKDIATFVQALTLVTVSVDVLVAGQPLDRVLLTALTAAVAAGGGRLLVHVGAQPRTVIRRLYAAADVALVIRRPSTGKESGLIADCAVLGVPLLVSEHDPDTTARVGPMPWVRLFPAGNASALARALDQLATAPLPRPPVDAAAGLGLVSAGEALAAFDRLQTAMEVTT